MEKIHHYHDVPDGELEADSPEAKILNSAEGVLSRLDLNFQGIPNKNELEQLPLDRLLPDASMPPKFWSTIPLEAADRIRAIWPSSGARDINSAQDRSGIENN